MQNNASQEQLKAKSESAAKTALWFAVPGVVLNTIAAIGQTIVDWKEKTSVSQFFFSFKNPGRIFKNGWIGTGYTLGLAGLITGLVYAVKGKAYSDSLATIDQPPVAEMPSALASLPASETKWQTQVSADALVAQGHAK